MAMDTLFKILIVLTVLCMANGDAQLWKKEIEYYETVILNCTEFADDYMITRISAWILPSGVIWYPGENTLVENTRIQNNGYILAIDRLDDIDFGMYYCIADTGSNEIQVVKFGINIDGPYYGPTYISEIKHSAMVGGIAAGCMLVFLAIIWLICAKCCRRKFNRHDEIELEPESKTESNPVENVENCATSETVNGSVKTTNVDDTIYYIADGVTPLSQQTSPYPVVDGWRSETLSSTQSGHYHSIGSIEANAYTNETVTNQTHGDRKYSDLGTYDAHDDKSSESGDESVFNDENTDKMPKHAKKESFENVESLYAKPMKRGDTDKEKVHIVNGEVIIEPTGIILPVTTTELTSVHQSASENVFVESLTDNKESSTKPTNIDHKEERSPVDIMIEKLHLDKVGLEDETTEKQNDEGDNSVLESVHF